MHYIYHEHQVKSDTTKLEMDRDQDRDQQFETFHLQVIRHGYYPQNHSKLSDRNNCQVSLNIQY